MDPNRILLLLTLLACAMLFARLVRAKAGQRGWLAVVVLVALITGAAQLALPEFAGYLGFAAWALLVMAPSLGHRQLQRLVGRQNYSGGQRLARVLAVLHPLDGWRSLPSLLASMELAQRGDSAAAAEILQRVQAEAPPGIGRQASLHLFRLRGDWPALLAWLEREATPDELGRDPTLLTHYLRGLAETGDPERMLATLRRHVPTLERAQLLGQVYLVAFAFSGRPAATARVFDGLLASMSADVRTFWLATAEAAAGDGARAGARFEALARSGDAVIRQSALARLARPPASAAGALSAESQEFLDELEKRLLHEERYAERTGHAGRKPRLTWALVVINVAMFAVEILAGGSEEGEVLYRLGAVFTPGFALADAWRLLASTFLHFGPLHLAMNMLGLFAMGPYLERALGAVRYLAVYLSAGIVGALAVVIVQSATHKEMLMVGASGSIMGLVGGTGAVLLRGWRAEGAEPALRRLRGVVVIFAMQVVFDVLTPQISFTAHFAGMIAGFVLCALVKHWQPAGPRPAAA